MKDLWATGYSAIWSNGALEHEEESPMSKPTTPKPSKVVDIKRTDRPETTPEQDEAFSGVTVEVSVMPDVTKMSEFELLEVLKALRIEARRREKEKEATRPKVGSKVLILRGKPKFVGKVGTALIVRKTRCFVAVPEFKSPAYVLLSDLELVND